MKAYKVHSDRAVKLASLLPTRMNRRLAIIEICQELKKACRLKVASDLVKSNT